MINWPLLSQGRISIICGIWDWKNDIGWRDSSIQPILCNQSSFADITSNPILRTYKLFETYFKFETYEDVVKDNHYRHALINLRTSSHSLEIERGRYNMTDVKERLCPYCMRIDDEKHLILNCDAIVYERPNKIRIRYPIFFDLDDLEKFQFLVMSEDPQILTWLAKFIYYGYIYIYKYIYIYIYISIVGLCM